MDTHKYYDFQKGLFCVHFPNRDGLSMEEITSIFSEFGEVITVARSGDDYGYRFVKYKNEDEVIRCVEGLRSHSSIRLKFRDPNYKKNRNNNNNDSPTGNSYAQKNYEHNGQRSDYNDRRNRQGFSTSGAERTTENKEQYVNTNNSTTQTEHRHYSAGEKRINDARRATKNGYDHDTLVQKLHEVQENFSEASKPAAMLRRPTVASEIFTPAHSKICEDNVNDSAVRSNSISLLTQNVVADVFCNGAQNLAVAGSLNGSKGAVPRFKCDDAAEQIPRLVMKNSASDAERNEGGTHSPRSAGEDAAKTETAKEVVVANIHTDFGVNYILHLFRKHDPLSISEMKIIPSLGLRFCIVYLQSLHQAAAIEKEFDKLKLSGKDLIVLRREKLAELCA